MFRFKPAVVFLTVMVSIACAPPSETGAPAMGSAEDEAAIAAAFQSMLAAYNDMDAGAMAAMVTEGHEGINAEGTHMQGRAGFQAQLESEMIEPRPEAFS